MSYIIDFYISCPMCLPEGSPKLHAEIRLAVVMLLQLHHQICKHLSSSLPHSSAGQRPVSWPNFLNYDTIPRERR